MIDLEICTDSFETAIAAANYKARRIELCANLTEGGTTPSFGMIQKCASLKTIEVHVMIRPRPGSFVYPEDELDVMARDIVTAAIAGAKGVVFGCLKPDNTLDFPSTLFLVETALKQKLEITFHRAIDQVPDIRKAIDDLANMGVKRILTSGGENTALEGIETIRQMVIHAQGRIQVMAGGGVNESNTAQLAQTGIDALHFTARRKIQQDLPAGMGSDFETDEEKIRLISQLIAGN